VICAFFHFPHRLTSSYSPRRGAAFSHGGGIQEVFTDPDLDKWSAADIDHESVGCVGVVDAGRRPVCGRAGFRPGGNLDRSHLRQPGECERQFRGADESVCRNGNSSYWQFDQASLPSGTTAGQIAQATLRIHVRLVNIAGTINVLPATSAWNELGMTFATAATGSTVAMFAVSGAGDYLVDVTGLVQDG